MISGILSGLQAVADPGLLLAIAVAVIFAQFVAAMPGLGGAFLLAVILPFLYGMDPLMAIAIMVAATATDGTGNTVTSVVFGVPGSPTGVASVFDGYPMAQRGEAGRAIGAGVGASVMGGVIGAMLLAVLIPVVRPIVLAIGGPEFFILVIVALYAIAYVREEALMKGLLSAGMGLALAFVGMEGSSGVARYTFGQLYLWDGLQIVPFMIGLFAISEMMELLRRGGTIAQVDAGLETNTSGAWEGVKDAVRHWRATVQSSAIGLGVGVLPGLGGSAAQFMAYAQTARTSKNPDPPFGQGNVQGVIAADAATNSKDGGSLVPTLAFGIPGSSSMAILLAALVTFGVQPGPGMLEDRLDVLWMIIFVLVIANIFAAAVVLSVTRVFVKLTYLRAAVIAPAVLVISMFGSYATTRHIGDVATAIALGFVGYFMKKYGYSRATFVIGFVLAPLLEHYFQQSLQIFGPTFLLQRPIALGLLGAMLLSVIWSIVKAQLRGRRRVRTTAPPGADVTDGDGTSSGGRDLDDVRSGRDDGPQ